MVSPNFNLIYIFSRNIMGQLGFHVQPDGIVTLVENQGQAWQAGLTQNSRLVEICKVSFFRNIWWVTQSHIHQNINKIDLEKFSKFWYVICRWQWLLWLTTKWWIS